LIEPCLPAVTFRIVAIPRAAFPRSHATLREKEDRIVTEAAAPGRFPRDPALEGLLYNGIPIGGEEGNHAADEVRLPVRGVTEFSKEAGISFSGREFGNTTVG